MEVLIETSPANGPFSIAMFDYRRVVWLIDQQLVDDEFWLRTNVDFRYPKLHLWPFLPLGATAHSSMCMARGSHLG